MWNMEYGIASDVSSITLKWSGKRGGCDRTWQIFTALVAAGDTTWFSVFSTTLFVMCLTVVQSRLHNYSGAVTSAQFGAVLSTVVIQVSARGAAPVADWVVTLLIHCNGQYNTAQHCIALHIITQHSTTLHNTEYNYTTLHNIARACIELHNTAKHCTTLHIITWHLTLTHNAALIYI